MKLSDKEIYNKYYNDNIIISNSIYYDLNEINNRSIDIERSVHRAHGSLDLETDVFNRLSYLNNQNQQFAEIITQQNQTINELVRFVKIMFEKVQFYGCDLPNEESK